MGTIQMGKEGEEKGFTKQQELAMQTVLLDGPAGVCFRQQPEDGADSPKKLRGKGGRL